MSAHAVIANTIVKPAVRWSAPRTGGARFPAALATVLALPACVVLPVYAPAAGEPMATIDVARLPSPAFCVDGVGYHAPKAGTGLIAVPATRRLSLYSNFSSSDGYMTYYCTAGAAYTFAPGARLVAALEQNSVGCRVDLVRLDDAAPTGVAAEPSVGPATCNPWE